MSTEPQKSEDSDFDFGLVSMTEYHPTMPKIEPNNLEWLERAILNLHKDLNPNLPFYPEATSDSRKLNEFKLAITAKINEIELQARIDELLRLTRFKMIKTNTGTTDHRIVERLAELRKRKDEVL